MKELRVLALISTSKKYIHCIRIVRITFGFIISVDYNLEVGKNIIRYRYALVDLHSYLLNRKIK